MIKKLLLIEAFMISSVPVVLTDTNGGNYVVTPQKSKIFSDQNGDHTVILNNWYRHFLIINIPVL
ncbi:MAG: hypothetical protein Q8K36_02400 [Alphaproteobacteria bacterium]|nr:hypothetical protein [Alphaproteobacteria bacterium]